MRSVSTDGLKPELASGLSVIAERYVGKPTTVKSLRQLAQDVAAHLKENGRPLVTAYLPEQAMRNGIVQIVVLESKLGRRRVENNQHFFSEAIVKKFHRPLNEPIDELQEEMDLKGINRNPFRNVQMSYEAGEVPGTTDIVLDVQDRFMVRPTFAFDNTGSKLTGDYRLQGGFIWGNAFNRGDMLSYRSSSDLDYKKTKSHSLSYTAFLQNMQTLTIFAAHSDSNANFESIPGLQSSGSSNQAGLRYERLLSAVKAKDSSYLETGFDFKQSDSSLEYNSVEANGTLTDVVQGMLGFRQTIPDESGSSSWAIRGFASPGKTTGNNGSRIYSSAGAGDPLYAYVQVEASRITKLPADMSWLFKANGQISSTQLLGSEQIGIGGMNSVRGYEERESGGDRGFAVVNEIRSKMFNLGGETVKNVQGQVLCFVDYGHAEIHNANVNDSNPNVDLLGIGGGLRLEVAPYANVNFDYGWQLSDSGESFLVRHGDNSRGHVSVNVSY